MTIENYSTQGLKDLLDELEKLATCLIVMPRERVNDEVWNKILENQFELIQEAQAYANILLINKS